MDLGEDQLFERHAGAAAARSDGAEIHDFARAMYARRLEQRGRIGPLAAVGEAVEVTGAGPHALDMAGEVAVALRAQRPELSLDRDLERRRPRRPDAKIRSLRIGHGSEPHRGTL